MSREEAGCLTARERFSAAYDGELAASERIELERHLASCPSCRAAQAAFTATFDQLGRSLHAAVDRVNPRLPFPAVPAAAGWRMGWPVRAALVAAAGALAALILGPPLRTERFPLAAAAPPRLAGRHAAEDCPWRQTSLVDIAKSVSYPVMADACLDHAFELVEARVTRGRPCGENLRLVYRAGESSFVLEQHAQAESASCPGEPVLVGEIAACLEQPGLGGTSLRWSHANRVFHLSGDVAPAEAFGVARNINARVAGTD